MSGGILFSMCLLFLIILFKDVYSNMLPRIRDGQEYGPRSDLEIIKNLDDKTYEELISEIPVLKKVFQGNRKDETFQFNSSALPMLYRGEILERPNAPPVIVTVDIMSHRPSIDKSTNTYPSNSISSKITHKTHWPTIKQKKKNGIPMRRAWYDDPTSWSITANWDTVYPHIISCYWCGLNDTLIPKTSVCHTIWDSDDTRLRDLGRFFRARCFYYDYYRFYDRQIKAIRWYPATVEYKNDHGLKTNMFGPYMKGCFKRFVDVGPLYTARGCRGRFLPWRAYTRSFASHRLMRLEIVARGHEDVCVHSPEASLTPYSRAISLFVRYHVCVCPTSYCNSATLAVAPRAAMLSFIVPLIVIN